MFKQVTLTEKCQENVTRIFYLLARVLTYSNILMFYSHFLQSRSFLLLILFCFFCFVLMYFKEPNLLIKFLIFRKMPNVLHQSRVLNNKISWFQLAYKECVAHSRSRYDVLLERFSKRTRSGKYKWVWHNTITSK